MPRGDGTGPVGMGPLTGRGAGFCAGYANLGFGCGRGLRRNPGRPGYMRGAGAASTQEDALKEQAEALEAQLKEVKERLGSLKKDGE